MGILNHLKYIWYTGIFSIYQNIICILTMVFCMVKKKMDKKKILIISLVAFLAVGGGIFGILIGTGVIDLTPQSIIDLEETTPPTTITLRYLNESGEILDGNDGASEALGFLYTYEYENETFTDDDLNALTFTDFTLWKENLDHGSIVTPQVNTIYILQVNSSDSLYSEEWLVPHLGINNISLRAIPTNISIALTDLYGDPTINETDTVDWFGTIFCLDADGDVNDDVGYDLVYDYSLMVDWESIEDTMYYPALVFDCNGTGIETSDIKISGLYVKETQISSDKIIVYLNQGVSGRTEFSFKIDANDLGVDFEINSVYLARGVLGGTLTTLCTAA